MYVCMHVWCAMAGGAPLLEVVVGAIGAFRDRVGAHWTAELHDHESRFFPVFWCYLIGAATAGWYRLWRRNNWRLRLWRGNNWRFLQWRETIWGVWHPLYLQFAPGASGL